ncbi:MAG: hypothetical protein ACOYVF_03855 [Candidatus Zixiibacteriota bacterium]
MILLTLLVFACSSRYRMEMFMDTGDERREVRVEEKEFFPNTVLNDPYADMKLLNGDGNCLIVTIGARGDHVETDRLKNLIFEYDEYLKKRIYLQLPGELRPMAINLTGKSFIQLLGRYDQPADNKIFVPQSGTLVIDSLVNQMLFATLNGLYATNSGETVAFDGRFKVKLP